MGVPKFYRWISERYPCLSEVVKEYQVPEFDNLYLDMNGIIHVCSHPNDDDPHFRITEEQIFKDIFHYIEVLFRIIRPRKVFFMAVDGVAPRAKMNQQRGRRFRSAKEAEENIKKALQKGEMLPEEKRFDSNCITPGTKFMVRLQEQLEYMVKSKVSSDPAWQDIRIFLSGHETPGEGEHKITEFIRQERMKASYDPNTRHCLYGLDADLMMLGLCSHEPHFSLLREEVRFTGKKKHHAARTPKPEETTFHLLHLSLMREYIDHEFKPLKKTLPFQYDLEAIIDDWVLMGFLVGNDFIPHLPNLHIAHNALPMLYDTYKQVLPTLDGYLNENGIVNLPRFEKYLEVLSLFDFNKFEEVYADFKWLESKVGKKKAKGAKGVKNASRTKNAFETLTNFDDGESSEGQSSDMSMQQKSIQVVTELSIKQGLTSADSEVESNGSQDDGSTYQLEFQLFKRNYYQEKLHFKGTDAEVQKIAYEYILAIQWICHYYYNGVQSWSWYYPYHYAPFLSDLRNLSQMKLKYDIGNPFLPYEQLLAVLPAASKECLPESFWNLMSSSTSSIIDYYPLEFQCDLNGKQQEWEAVVLIPFINEERLLAAMQPCLNSLSKSEKERNKHSGCQLYTFDSNLDYYVKSSLEGTFPNVAHCKAKLDIVALHSWSSTDIASFVKGVLPGCRLSVYYPGFPTLYHLPHSSSLQKKGVKVFQMPSRNENMILVIYSPGETPPDQDIGSQPYKSTDNLDDVAKNLLGTSIYVNWPHMEEAKVVAVSDENVKYEVTEHIHATGLKGSKHKMQRKTLPKDEQKNFWQDLDSISESYMTSRGIDVGETQFLVYAQPLLGRKYVCGQQGQITLEKQWATVPRAYALQATVKDISVKDPTFQQFKGMEELFPTGSTVFMLGQPHYGCQGKVTQVHNEMTSVVFDTRCEPDIESVIRQRHKLNMAYYPGWELGSRLGISNYLVSRITGTIFVFYPNTQKWQVGLNLRFTKEGCGIAGYTKFVNSEWRYSEAVEKTLVEYMEKFPEVLTYLGSALKRNENDFDAQKMVKLSEESDVVARLKELSAWLKSLSCYHGDKVNEHSDMIENKVVMAVVEKVEQCKKKKPLNPVEITLRPHVLYRPLAHQGTLIPDKSAQHRLLDRIVNARDGYTVPLGLRGTIIGIHKQPAQDVLFDVVFDEEFLGGIEFGGRCPKRRGYRMPECAMINLSYGMRFGNKEKRPTAVVRPQNKQHMKQQAQPQSGRDRQVPARRGSSPRYSRSNRDTRQTPRESQRVQSNFQPTLMQRPTSSSAQSTRPKAANPSSSDNMFDTLWNTLKEQNKESSPISQQQESQKAANVNQRSTRRKESRGVPVITAPDPQNLGKALSGSPLGIPNFTSLSLSQAAKSLPKVKPMQNEKNTEKKQSSTMITSSSTVSSATVESRKERSHPQQTSTKPTTTVTQSVSGPDSTSAEHLDNLFKKIKGAPAQSPSYAPRLAFTPTQHIPSPRITSPMKSPPMRMPGPPSPMNHPMNIPPFHPQFGPRQQYPNQYPPFFSRPPFVLPPGPRNMPPNFPGMFLNRPITRNPTTFSQQPFPRWLNNDTTSTKHDQTFIPTQVYLQSKKQKNEGTQKLSELLNSENDDASSSKWSTGEEEDDKSKASDNTQTATSDETAKENITKKFDDISMKDEDDGDSLKDDEDYMERSTSVEDENPAILKKQTKVDELMSLCTQCSMMPPIYTYFTTGDEQVVSTVQLWNGVRFSSHPQITRDKAMEEAAGQALGYLKSELRENRPVSTSPPTTLPYYMPVQNLVPPQYYAHHAAYASPVSYTSASPQPYFIPSVPYTVLPQTPVVTIPSEYQQATLVHSHFRLNAHQYNPYVHQYPLVRVQVSPSHQPKPAYHIAANPKPVVWTGYPKDPYFIQDKANSPRTEFKLLDQPPAFTNLEDESTELRPNALLTEESSKKSMEGNINIQNGDDKKETEPKKHVKKTSSPSRKKQNSAKPKLAISFNNSAKEK